jgi:ankyrin repeat protein
VSLLIEAGANPDIRDKDGWTALMLAAIHNKNRVPIIEELVESGADPKLKNGPQTVQKLIQQYPVEGEKDLSELFSK